MVITIKLKEIEVVDRYVSQSINLETYYGLMHDIMVDTATSLDTLLLHRDCNANELIEPLEKAIETIKNNPRYHKRLLPIDRDHQAVVLDIFVLYLERLLAACKENTGAVVFRV